MTRLHPVLLAIAIAASGCATTQQEKVQDGSAAYCPFMGAAVCAKLVQGEAPSRVSSGSPATARAYLRYVNADAQWTKYNAVLLQPVTFWADDDSKVSVKEQHDLTAFFQQSLEKQLGTKYQMVNEPGPNVMRIQVAID